MSNLFSATIVVTDDEIAVAIKQIESMSLCRNDADTIVDNLKGDAVLDIRTVSGKKYAISMLTQMKSFPESYKLTRDVLLLREQIFNKWVYLTNN